MSDTSKTTIFLLAGVAAGVTIGLLFSPQKGRENREKITNSLIDFGETVRDIAAETIENIISVTTNVINHFQTDHDLYAEYHDDIENAII